MSEWFQNSQSIIPGIEQNHKIKQCYTSLRFVNKASQQSWTGLNGTEPRATIKSTTICWAHNYNVGDDDDVDNNDGDGDGNAIIKSLDHT